MMILWTLSIRVNVFFIIFKNLSKIEFWKYLCRICTERKFKHSSLTFIWRTFLYKGCAKAGAHSFKTDVMPSIEILMKCMYSVVHYLSNKHLQKSVCTSNKSWVTIGFVKTVVRTPPENKRCKKWTKVMGGVFQHLEVLSVCYLKTSEPLNRLHLWINFFITSREVCRQGV